VLIIAPKNGVLMLSAMTAKVLVAIVKHITTFSSLFWVVDGGMLGHCGFVSSWSFMLPSVGSQCHRFFHSLINLPAMQQPTWYPTAIHGSVSDSAPRIGPELWATNDRLQLDRILRGCYRRFHWLGTPLLFIVIHCTMFRPPEQSNDSQYTLARER
jgi:hypothetical protein